MTTRFLVAVITIALASAIILMIRTGGMIRSFADGFCTSRKKRTTHDRLKTMKDAERRNEQRIKEWEGEHEEI